MAEQILSRPEDTREEPSIWAFDPISIRYEGDDAEEHLIDLAQLGVSLQGFARILAVSSHFVQTGKYNKQYDALSVKVFAAPVQEHHCYEIMAAIRDVAMSSTLWSGTGGAVLAAIVAYILSRRQAEEMKHLSAALQTSLQTNSDTNAKLLATIEKMADALRPAAKQAVAPIGNTCQSISLGTASSPRAVFLRQEDKDRLTAPADTSIEGSRDYVGIISEMDMETGSCKVALEGDEAAPRIVAIITDPAGRVANNAYVRAMSEIRSIAFIAKAEIDHDGNIVRLYISDLHHPKTT